MARPQKCRCVCSRPARTRFVPEGAEGEEPEETWKLIERLERYDIISFDIFDTLLLRPFSDPTELFYLLDIRFFFIVFVKNISYQFL